MQVPFPSLGRVSPNIHWIALGCAQSSWEAVGLVQVLCFICSR